MRCNKTKQNKFTKLIVLFKLFKLESCNLKTKKSFVLRFMTAKVYRKKKKSTIITFDAYFFNLDPHFFLLLLFFTTDIN